MHLMETRQVKLGWKKLRRGLTIKKSSWDPRIPATFICQSYAASQIRQKTKENVSTKDKKVLQATVLNSFFQYCRKEQICSGQKSHHHPSITWSKKGVTKLYAQMNHLFSGTWGERAWILTQINFYKSQNSNLNFYSPLSAFTSMMLLNAIYSFLFNLPSLFHFLSFYYSPIPSAVTLNIYLFIIVCLVPTTSSAGNAHNYNLM